MTMPDTLMFEISTDGRCRMRVEILLDGSQERMYGPTLELMRQVLLPAATPSPPPAEVGAPGPPSQADDKVLVRAEEPDRLGELPAEEPDPDPEPPGEPTVAQSGVEGDVLDLLRDADGEITDSAGKVTAKVAELSGLPPSTVKNALFRLRAKGLVVRETTSARRTTAVTLTAKGWSAVGGRELVAVGSNGAGAQQRARDRAAGAMYETPDPARRAT